MSVCWTEKQLEAIEAKGRNILVAAAAGSGKTAVLVERIIRIITNKENPVSVDRLLVLTFTDAAASEMKRKIADAIDKKLDENPDDEWLREQSIKVGSACISTIHSFCSRILTNNAHLTDLPAEFSLIDDTENKLLQRQALDAVMESYYSHIDKREGFRQLVTGWSDVKGDENLRDIIIRIHNLSRSLAYPRRWLTSIYRDGYGCVKEGGSLEGSVWISQLTSLIYSYGVRISDALDEIISIVERDIPADHPFYAYYYNMYHSFCDTFRKIDINAEDALDKLTDLISTFEVKRAVSKKGIEDIEPRLTFLRDEFVKKSLKEAAQLLEIFENDNTNRLAGCAPAVKALCNIVRLTEKVHQKYKRERSAIDFNDLEHGLFRLLCDERGNETPLCQKLRDYYYEIEVDEFQDTNSLQFEIFSHLSKPDGNLFMVGDVKQSIYKFRNADPTIFLNLCNEYKGGKGGQLICLSQNFRSRDEVVNSVNDIFESVMSVKCGEVDYTEDERLVRGATYPNSDSCETEVMITDMTDSEIRDALLLELETENLEARAVADRIYNLVCVERIKVFDKETNEMRDIQFGDIAVLCRTKPDRNIIESELIRLGISSVTEGGQHYLTSVEVSAILAFLQIIDNPIQDIPLIAVMRSSLFGFTPEELAKIRTAADGRFFSAVSAAAENDKKTADFLAVLSELRSCAKYMGVDELVRKICNDLHYFAIVGAMPGGELRKANLKLLLKRCSDYEQGSLTGLFNFIKYIEMLKATGEDLVPAKEESGKNNSVRIMTIHKSKGLEFPVVILFHTGKNFNREDLKKNIIWHEKSGIGLDYVDTRQRVRFPLPTRSIVKERIISSSVAEEMRLLYVAMTRAKEKLIISASISSKYNNWKKAEFDSGGHLSPCLSLYMSNMRDWILSALLNHPSASALRQLADRNDIIPSTKTNGDFKVYTVDFSDRHQPTEETEASQKEDNFSTDFDPRETLDYIYPYAELSRLPIKLSVSELKRRRMPEEDSGTGYLLNTPTALITDTKDIGAAERGTITHFVLQHMDIHKTDSLSQIEEQLEDMVKTSAISLNQKNSVDINSIYGFFSGELGKRLKAAEKFEREYDFYMQVNPNEIDESISSDSADDIILQGIADCFFYDGDGIVLIDYKTDRVGKHTAEKRAEAYRIQIEYYSAGLASVLGLPVKERYLYFLNCGEMVKM